MIGATWLILLVAGWIIGFIDIAINEDEVTWVTHSSVVSQCLGGSMLLYSLKTRSAPEACKVFAFGDYADPIPRTPDRHVAIGDLLAKWDSVPERQAAMALARGWAADALHADDGVTLRTLRMKKGISQQQLAASIGTSQPHIARIEGGADNLNIDTCRRLAKALGVDLNALNESLIRQQSLNDKKQR